MILDEIFTLNFWRYREKSSDISPQWNVILMLIEILKIVHAPTMNKIISYLKELIATHHKSYTDVHLKPKHRITTHYPIYDNGKTRSIRGIWAIRYSAKHQFIKDLTRKLKNFFFLPAIINCTNISLSYYYIKEQPLLLSQRESFFVWNRKPLKLYWTKLIVPNFLTASSSWSPKGRNNKIYRFSYNMLLKIMLVKKWFIMYESPLTIWESPSPMSSYCLQPRTRSCTTRV